MKKSNAVENLALSFIAVGLTPESLRALWQSYSLRLAVDKKAGMSIVLWNTRIAAVKLALKMREINV